MPRRGSLSSQSGRMQIQAVGAAQGLAMGQAQLRLRPLIEIAEKRVPASAIDHQLDRLHCAVDAASEEMRALRDRLRGAMEREVGDILELHALLIDDPELLQNLDALIRSHRYSAEYALQVQHATLTAIFKEMEDPYLQSRMDDLDHVITRIQAFLQHPPRANANGKAGGILISESVSPSELAELQAQGVVQVVHAALEIGVFNFLEDGSQRRMLNLQGIFGTVTMAADECVEVLQQLRIVDQQRMEFENITDFTFHRTAQTIAQCAHFLARCIDSTMQAIQLVIDGACRDTFFCNFDQRTQAQLGLPHG